MAELFSPVWKIQREEITDLNAYRNAVMPDFKKITSITPVEEFTGSLSEVKARCNELIKSEPSKLRYSVPPSVKYYYKLKQ